MKICPFFVPHAQSPELIQPGKGSLYHPAPSAQSTAVFGVAHREERDDAALTQTSSDCHGIITAVA